MAFEQQLINECELGQDLVKKVSFCPPVRNNYVLPAYLVNEILLKVQECGVEFVEFVNKKTNEISELPAYCDNRICENPSCKGHRGYKFAKNHSDQIFSIDSNILRPKGWVFTTPRVNIYLLKREYIKEKTLELKRLNERYASSEFSIHCEIKVKPPDERYKFYTFYMHYHVACGGYKKDIRFLMNRWGYAIRYEYAIKKNELNRYISKYASKTPNFFNDEIRILYLGLTYKTKMHIFSVGHKKNVNDLVSDYYCLSRLENEVFKCLFNSSYHNFSPKNSLRYYYQFIEDKLGKRKVFIESKQEYEIREKITENKPSVKEVQDFYDDY